MDVIFFLFVIKLLVGAFLIAAIPLFLYFEIAYSFKGDVTNHMVKGIVLGLIWGLLFAYFTALRSSSVGTAMVGPVILVCFPIIGLMIGMVYEKRKRPLIARRQKTSG